MLAQYLVFIKKLQYVTVTRTIFTSVAFFDSFTYMSFAALMPDSSPTNQEPSPQSIEWALKLFSKSPLKQQKLRRIESLCPKFSGKICLDIGSDNGVISLKLREQGGVWYSADLLPETVASIQSLVGERVSQIDGQKLPYVDDQFDLVVIVDFLEHIDTDRKCVEEISRILKPGAELIINVPNPQKGLLRSIKHLIGQTDEAHGHVRPGYSIDQLNKLLDGLFVIESH
ncbi:MAG: class I SAM-dependent methyltransferase, partial [Bdellovibrionales bacterium]|nr:class I SAM-dependent methyltransferase [Bdellovibrionales bacterium]